LASQPGLQREVLDLSKIKRKMVENLSKLPDYTCVETVERSARQTETATFRAVDSRFSGIQVAIQSDDSASARSCN
jgi:hypothetical protein